MTKRRFTIKYDFEVEWPHEVPADVITRLQETTRPEYPAVADLVSLGNALLAAGTRNPDLMQKALNFYMVEHVRDFEPHGAGLSTEHLSSESQSAIDLLAAAGGEPIVSLLKKHDGDISGLTESIKISIVDAEIVETT